MSNKIYIVTGATGFVGSTLVGQLLREGKTVHALVRSKEKAAEVLGETSAKLFFGDARNESDIEALFTDPEAAYIVMHTAAMIILNGKKPLLAQMREVNVEGTKQVIEACLRHRAKMIYVSSVHAIPELPKKGLMTETLDFNTKKIRGIYAKSKAEASALVIDAIKNRALNAVIVHPAGIAGPGDPGQTHLTQMVIDYMQGRIPAATKGGYNFVDVRDVCFGIKAAENAESGQTYLLTNRYSTVTEVLTILHEETGCKKITKTYPMWLARVGLPFLTAKAKMENKRPLYTSYSLYTLRSNSNFSNEKAVKELGFSPRELRESLRDTVQYLKDKGRV